MANTKQLSESEQNEVLPLCGVVKSSSNIKKDNNGKTKK